MVCNSPSLAVRRRMYAPDCGKVAVVTGVLDEPKITVPGPATCVHVMVRLDGCGNPSSVTVALRTRAELVLLSVARAPTGELITITGGRLETAELGIISMPLDNALSLMVAYWIVTCPLLSGGVKNSWMFARV